MFKVGDKVLFDGKKGVCVERPTSWNTENSDYLQWVRFENVDIKPSFLETSALTLLTEDKKLAFVYESSPGKFDWVHIKDKETSIHLSGSFSSIQAAAMDAISFGFCWIECTIDDIHRIIKEWKGE